MTAKATFSSIAYEFKATFSIDDLSREAQVTIMCELMRRAGLNAIIMSDDDILRKVDAALKDFASGGPIHEA